MVVKQNAASPIPAHLFGYQLDDWPNISYGGTDQPATGVIFGWTIGVGLEYPAPVAIGSGTPLIGEAVAPELPAAPMDRPHKAGSFPLRADDGAENGNGASLPLGGASADRFVFGAISHGSPKASDAPIDLSSGPDLTDFAAINASPSLVGGHAFLWSEQNGAELGVVLPGTGLHLTAQDFVL